MLKILRKYSRSWFIALAIGAIVVVFIFWGVGGFRSPQFQEVASVNDTAIILPAFMRQYNDLVRSYQERAKGELTEEDFKSLRLKEQALNQLIDEALVLQAAQRLGIQVSTAELQEHIRRIPYFQENGQFSERRYRGILGRSRISPGDFEAQEGRRLLMQKLVQAVTAFAKVSSGELQELFRLGREQVAVSYLVVSPAPFQARLKPTEAEIADYYRDHQAEFRTPERVRVRYVLFKPQTYLEQVKPSPQEVQAYLKEHTASLVRPLTIRAREIFLALPPKAGPAQKQRLEQQAQALWRQLQSGADFVELAQKYSHSEKGRAAGGDLGTIKRGQNLPEWEKVAFSLKAQEVGLASTPKGFHLIRVDEIQETEKLPEADALALATQQLRQAGGRRLALEAAQQARGLLTDTPLTEVAKKFNLTVQETPLWASNQEIPGLGASRASQEAVFRLKPHEFSRVLEVSQGVAIFQGLEHLPAAEPPLAQVKDQVLLALKQQQAQPLALQEVVRLLERLRQGEALPRVAAQAGLALHDSGWFTRMQGFLNQPQAEALTSAAFQLSASHPYPSQPLEWQGNYYLLAFKERRLPSEADFRQIEEKLKEEALQQKRQMVFQNWLTAERQQAKIKIYELP
jgi:peptidyl-prolyl cis-trans isomerase D